MLFKKSKKVFIHVDCDSFFASCEVLKNPSLKGKYVCVGHEIVLACTYNCKRLWVKTWTPVWEAKKILKNWIFLPPSHVYYDEISEKIFAYLKKGTLSIEPFSIDEAFCEISGLPEMYGISLEEYIKRIQKNILEEIGVPVSIGCANTRIKAKIYSKINKPFWIYIWFDEEREVELFKKLKVWIVPFIWKSLQERLKYRVQTVYDFTQMWFWELKKTIGKSATDLWFELVWVNAFIVKRSKEVKSISRSRSFNKSITSDKEFLINELIGHFERVFEDITSKNFEVKRIAIFFRTKSFQVLTYEHTFPEYTNNRKVLYDTMVSLFSLHFQEHFLYRSMGIIMSDFRSFLPRQTSIFDTTLRWKEDNYRLYKTLETINKKYGDHKISFWMSLLGIGKESKGDIRK